MLCALRWQGLAAAIVIIWLNSSTSIAAESNLPDPLGETRVVGAKLVKVLVGKDPDYPYGADYEITKVYCGSNIPIGATFRVSIEVGAGAGDSNAMHEAPETGETGIWTVRRDRNTDDLVSGTHLDDELPFAARRGVTVDFARREHIADGIHQVWIAAPDGRLRLLDQMVHGSDGGMAAVAAHLFARVKPAGWKDTLRQWMGDPKIRVEGQVALDGEMTKAFQEGWYWSKERLAAFARWPRSAVDDYDVNRATMRVLQDSDSIIRRNDTPAEVRERWGAGYQDFFADARNSKAFRKNENALFMLARDFPRLIPDREATFLLLTRILVEDDNKRLSIGCIQGINHEFSPLTEDEAKTLRKLRPKILAKEVLMYIDTYMKDGQK